MRTIHYRIRFAIVLGLILLFYWAATFLFHQAVLLPTLILLLLTTLCTERLWALLEWMSPIFGTVNAKEQEQSQKRILEHELSRSQRYGSQLVIAAIREKKRTSLHVVAQHLRNTDKVLRSSAKYLLVLMPNTTLEEAREAFKRINTLLPIKDIVMADESMFLALVKSQASAVNGVTGGTYPRELRRICTQALNAKLASIESSQDEADAPAIYHLIEPRSPDTLPGQTRTRQLELQRI